jgi:hypothetical protein
MLLLMMGILMAMKMRLILCDSIKVQLHLMVPMAADCNRPIAGGGGRQFGLRILALWALQFGRIYRWISPLK